MDAIEEQCGRDPAGIIARYKHAMEWANVLDEIPLQARLYEDRAGSRYLWAYSNISEFREMSDMIHPKDISLLDPVLLFNLTKDAHLHTEDPMVLVKYGDNAVLEMGR